MNSPERETRCSTSTKSPPANLSSAEKVKTWLIQANNEFESKNILNEVSNPDKPLQCDEDSDGEMLSVSQFANNYFSENPEPVKSTQKVTKIGAGPSRRSLNMRKINLITSKADSAFDKLLPDAKTSPAIEKNDSQIGKGKKSSSLSKGKACKMGGESQTVMPTSEEADIELTQNASILLSSSKRGKDMRFY